MMKRAHVFGAIGALVVGAAVQGALAPEAAAASRKCTVNLSIEAVVTGYRSNLTTSGGTHLFRMDQVSASGRAPRPKKARQRACAKATSDGLASMKAQARQVSALCERYLREQKGRFTAATVSVQAIYAIPDGQRTGKTERVSGRTYCGTRGLTICERLTVMQKNDPSKNKRWLAKDFKRLCFSRDLSIQPVRCYRAFMVVNKARLPLRFRTRANAINLCEAASSSKQVMDCFNAKFAQTKNLARSITECDVR